MKKTIYILLMLLFTINVNAQDVLDENKDDMHLWDTVEEVDSWDDDWKEPDFDALEEAHVKNEEAQVKNEEAQVKNEEAQVKNEEAHKRKIQLENILLWS